MISNYRDKRLLPFPSKITEISYDIPQDLVVQGNYWRSLCAQAAVH